MRRLWVDPHAIDLAARPVGPWRASLEAIDELAVLGHGDPLRGGGRPQMVVTLCPGCGREVRHATLAAVPHGAGPDERATELSGRGDVLQGFVPLPAELSGSELILSLEGWDGRRHEACWPLE